MPNLVLGPGDSLTDRAPSVCSSRASDLGDGQPGHQPQRQRQLRLPVQRRVRAGEHHPQLVVAHRMRVGVIGTGPDIVHHSCQFLSGTDGFAT